MSHRSRRSDDRDERSHSSSHSSHKYDKYGDRDYYHSRNSSSRGDKSRSKYRSRSRSPSHSSKSHSRYHRSRSRSHSRSHGYSSRHYDDHHSRSHRSKDYKDSLPDSRSRRDSHDHSQSKYTTDKHSHDKFDANTFTKLDKYKSSSSAERDDQGPMSISYNNNANDSESNDYLTYEPPKTSQTDADAVLEEEKQRIQRETLERLQKHLEKEGKAYPPPRPQASHPIFANDGSFLEMFKSMQGNLQQQQQSQQQTAVEPTPVVKPTAVNPVTRFQPLKRRGPKILKTGMVQKQRAIEETDEAQPSDSWNAYLKEVKKYKTVTCTDENMTRSLVK